MSSAQVAAKQYNVAVVGRWELPEGSAYQQSEVAVRDGANRL